MPIADKITRLDPIPPELFVTLRPVADLGLDPMPFVLIKPMSLHWTCTIRQMLVEEGLTIEDEQLINGYEQLARYLYEIEYPPSYRFQWLMLARKLEPAHYDQAYVFLLNPDCLRFYSHVESVKYTIRARLGIVRHQVRFYANRLDIQHNHIHIPDEHLLAQEFNLLVQFGLT
ncbi:MAG: hypothetical protein OHK0046_25280 [Anaerolineae bacterium]